MKARLRSFALYVGIVLLPAAVSAQNYSVDWYVVAGGGGISTHGQYAISGTIGQPEAGAMNGGNFSLTGGFWGLLAVAPMAGAPLLSIARTPTNTVVLSWPSASTGFVLQQTSTLAPANWSDASQAPVDDGVTRSVVISPPTGNQFFRLRQ